MATKCFDPILGKRIRVTRLDSCGNVPDPEDTKGFVSTDGFISINLSSEVEDGVEIVTRKADGSLCVNEMGDSSFKRFNVEIEFCGVNPDLLALVSNAETYTVGADTAGITIPEGTLAKRFALELWTGLTGAACDPDADEASGYMLLPFLAGGVLGDLTIDGENAITFSITGAFTKGGNSWGVGPYEVIRTGSPAADGPLPTSLDPMDHFLLIETNLAPPPVACAIQPMPDPS